MKKRSEHGHLKLALRLAVGSGLLAILLLRARGSALLEVLGGVHLPQLALGIVAVLLGVAVGGLRWRPFLEELDLSLPALAAVRLTIVGSFFNAFLPTGFGGDGYKALRLRGGEGATSRALASVLLDRWAGIAGMAILGIAGSVVRLGAGDRSKPPVAGLVLGLGILGASSVMLALGPRLVARIHQPDRTTGIRANLALLAQAIIRTGRHPRAATSGLTLGLASAGCVLIGHVFLANALGIHVPVGALAAILLIAALITIVPITVNGLGLREASYVWALGAYGIDHDKALAFALLILGAILASSLAGGLLYLFGGAEVTVRNTAQLSGHDEKA